MEIEEIREKLLEAQQALDEATNIDRGARSLAIRTEALTAYLDGPEKANLRKARKEFDKWAVYLEIGLGGPVRPKTPL